MPQTSVQQNMTARWPGRLSKTVPYTRLSGKAAAAIAFGLLLLKSPTDADGLVRAPADLSAADTDAILVTGASAATPQTFDANDFDGVVGSRLLRPSRFITITFSSHANWDIGIGRLYGIGDDGQAISEPVHVRDAGAYTFQSRYLYRKVTKLELPAGAGTAGTFLIGYAASSSAAYVADDDAIMTSVATAAAAQVFTGADLTGVLGQLYTYPAKFVTITQNAHNDWNATTLRLEGEDEQGNPITDNLATIADAGGVVTSVKKFSRVTRIDLPAQTGTNGTLLVGYAADAGGAIQWGSLYQHDGFAEYDDSIEQAATPAGYPSTYMVRRIVAGVIDGISEVAVVKDAQVFVRLVATGGEVRGHLRMDDDGGDAVPVVGCFFDESRAAGAVMVRQAA